MVKYPERGLVQRGAVSPLFERLYLVTVGCLSLVLCTFSLATFLNKNTEDSKSNFNLLCTNQSVDYAFNSMKGLALMNSFTGFLLLIVTLMFLSIKYFVRHRTQNKNPPAIYGRYRRCVLTLDETFYIGLIHFLNYFTGSFIVNFHEKFGLGHETARLYLLLNGLIIHNFISGFVWPVYILCHLRKNMPEFFTNRNRIAAYETKVFYITGRDTIKPRRPSEPRLQVNDCQKRKSSKFLFVKGQHDDANLQIKECKDAGANAPGGENI